MKNVKQTSRHRGLPSIVAAQIAQPRFLRLYGVVAGCILLATTIYWSVMASVVHQHNADQLIDPYLFEQGSTFHQAVFPGQHTFLLKWPLFLLIRLFGSTPLVFGAATVVLSVITVGLLAFVLYRIDRRPVIFGTLFLALASVLLLVPAEASPGALLPVNMAMLSTRNLEYIVYIASLILLIKAPRLLHWKTALAAVILASLIASDKLFLSLSLGGGLIALVIYLLSRRRPFINLALRWLLVTLVAAGVAFGLLLLISVTHLTNIDNSAGASPYSLTHSLKDFVLGSGFGLLDLLTNFGANPVADVTIVKNIPGQLLQRLLSPTIVGYLVNIGLVIIGLVFSIRLFKQSLKPTIATRHTKRRLTTQLSIDTPLFLSLSLVATTLAAFGIFIATTHAYAVDARYVSIVLFAGFIAGATYLRRLKPAPKLMLGIGLIITLGIGFSAFTASQIHNRSINSLSANERKDSLVADALSQHKVDTLIGDYWRTVPIKAALTQSQDILPLSDCTTPRTILSSKAWQQDVTSRSFAYLLPLTSSTTGYPACSIDQIVAKYGRPNASQVIAGNITNPEEILLFYDYGANTPVKYSGNFSASILPRPINQLSGNTCDSPTTIMNIVAHQDDDLLFMNPDLLHSVRDGACVRSVYITAGDAGNNDLYWLGREEGSRAAYARMLNVTNPIWLTRTVSLSDTTYATVSKLKGDSRVSLVFLHLPDGNVGGQGFLATRYESLEKLEAGTIKRITAADKQSSYTSDDLTSTLVSLMETFQPTEIHTQALRNLSKHFPDHSDHLAAGRYAKRAYDLYTRQLASLPLKYYIGYPISDRPQNVSGQDLSDTQAIFFAYAEHDPGVCGSTAACNKMSYGRYLTRQYQATY